MVGRLPLKLTATIILSFSFLLFLSGWVLQQQSLNALKAAMDPAVPTLRARPKGPRRKPPFQLVTQPTSTFTPVRGGKPKKVAHFQYVTGKETLCNSIMVLAELDRTKTVADKVLLYPASWIGDEDGTWSRLLKAAASRYGIKVRAVGSLIEDDGSPAVPSLFHAFAELTYERVLYLDPTGLPLQNLDHLLYDTPGAPISGTRPYWLPQRERTQGALSGHLLVIEPSKEELGRVKKSLLEAPALAPITLLNNLYSAHALVLPQRPYGTMISEFRTGENREKYTLTEWDPERAAHESYYVNFIDESAPMPWFAWPQEVTEKIRPSKAEDDRVWRALYQRWARVRMDVCGLDLEPLQTAG